MMLEPGFYWVKEPAHTGAEPVIAEWRVDTGIQGCWYFAGSEEAVFPESTVVERLSGRLSFAVDPIEALVELVAVLPLEDVQKLVGEVAVAWHRRKGAL